MNVKKTEYLKDILKCVRCGGCKALCPTYDEALSEGMGARGRIQLTKALVSGEIKPSDLLNERIFSCILCGACASLCPLGVDVPAAICHARALLEKSDKKRRYIRFLSKFLTKWPDLSFKLLSISQHILLPVLKRKGLMPFRPELPDTPFRPAEQVYKVSRKRGRIAIFAGCSTNYLFPYLGEALINVLQNLGYEVVIPKGELCCGSPLRSLGLEEDAIVLAKRNYRIFSKLKVEAILSLCPSCTFTLKYDYAKTINMGLENAMDISEFFHNKVETKEAVHKSAVFHDPCHLYHGLGVSEEPRNIIRKIGVELIDSGYSGCCGFGGVFCFSNRGISENLLQKCSAKLINTDAEAIVTSCPGCMLYLSSYITDRPVIHLIELIEEAYCKKPSV